MDGSYKTAHFCANRRFWCKTAFLGEKLRIFARNCAFLRETAYFGLKLRILRKTARFGVNSRSFVHLFFSLLGKGCAVLFVNNCSPGVSISVGVMIYYLLFSLTLSCILGTKSKGGNQERKEM